ncbi:FAD-dependent oxidoreductase [Caldifermentibacillus hisashii]|uniref:FAD-dependent oxidoreductase n=1 Tax=Caldifermentibacillus hisashii TaxID=996558 RepID=UPI0033667198
MSKQLPQNPTSYWQDSVQFPAFPSINEDIEVDVAIIGGGITGVTSAYLLTQEGLKVALVEADRLMTGTTGNTTAKLTAQHGLFYDELISHFGEEKARLYYQANKEAMEFAKSLIEKHQIECDLKIEDAYVFTENDETASQLKKEMKAYEKLGIPGKLVEETALPFKVKQALIMPEQAQFHPLKYSRVLVEVLKQAGCLIYEQTVASKIEMGEAPKVLLKDGHTITCKYVLSCSHFPFHDEGFYFARMYAERSYVVGALVEDDFPGGMYINAEKPTRSIRYTPYQNEKLIIISGDHHKTGQGESTDKHYQNLQTYAENTFKVKEFVYRWSAQDYSTLDKVPFIGYLTDSNRNILVATGFRKWGMTHSHVAALLFRDLILDKENPYETLYVPSRFVTDPSVKRVIQTNVDVAKHLVKGKLKKPTKKVDDLKNEEGAIVQVDGKRCGAYKDKNGKLFLVDSTCTHMGCEIKWNSGEKTWDCPCHGSRFAINGDVVEGPAERPLKQVQEGDL